MEFSWFLEWSFQPPTLVHLHYLCSAFSHSFRVTQCPSTRPPFLVNGSSCFRMARALDWCELAPFSEFQETEQLKIRCRKRSAFWGVSEKTWWPYVVVWVSSVSDASPSLLPFGCNVLLWPTNCVVKTSSCVEERSAKARQQQRSASGESFQLNSPMPQWVLSLASREASPQWRTLFWSVDLHWRNDHKMTGSAERSPLAGACVGFCAGDSHLQERTASLGPDTWCINAAMCPSLKWVLAILREFATSLTSPTIHFVCLSNFA